MGVDRGDVRLVLHLDLHATPEGYLQDQDGTDMRRLGEYLALNESGRGDRWTWLARRLVQEELISERNDRIQRLYLRESGRRFLDAPWPLDYAA